MISINDQVEILSTGATGRVTKIFEEAEVIFVKLENGETFKTELKNVKKIYPAPTIRQAVQLVKEDFHDMVIRVSSPVYLRETIFKDVEELDPEDLTGASLMAAMLGERLEALIFEEDAY